MVGAAGAAVTNKGQTLIEVVFVLGITGVILSGLVFGIIYFNKAAQMTKKRSSAIDLAKSKMEELKTLKRNDPDSLWTMVEESPQTDEEITEPSSFTRRTIFSDVSLSHPYEAKLTVEVEWQDGSQTRTVDIITYLREY